MKSIFFKSAIICTRDLIFQILKGYKAMPPPDTLLECQARTEVALEYLLEKLGLASKSNEDAFLAFCDVARYRAAIREHPNDIPVLAITIIYALQSLAALDDSKKGNLTNPRNLTRAFCSLTETTLDKLREFNGSKITDEQGKIASNYINSGKWNEEMRKFVFDV